MRRAALAPLLALLLAPAGCGGGGSDGADRPSRASGPAAVGQAQVIRDWADALRGGDVAKAAHLFALPTIVANGTPPLSLGTEAQVEAFNRALPCGARLLRTVARRGFVFASFRLTDRSGAGAQHPCPGQGAKAAVAFRIVAGRIREWRRVTGLPRGGAPAPAVPAGPTESS